MELLILLASSDGRLVTRDEIAQLLGLPKSSLTPDMASILPSARFATFSAKTPRARASSRPSQARATASSASRPNPNRYPCPENPPSLSLPLPNRSSPLTPRHGYTVSGFRSRFRPSSSSSSGLPLSEPVAFVDTPSRSPSPPSPSFHSTTSPAIPRRTTSPTA